MTQQIAIWKNQHSNFFCLLDMLDSQIRAFQAAARPDYQLMLDISDYLIYYADRFHHPKEDVAITMLLRKAPAARLLAAQLNDDHEAIAKGGLLLRDRIHAVLDGLMIPRHDLEWVSAQYAAHYRSHMRLEEAELFPRLERRLDPSDWMAVERAVPAQRDPLFGELAQERYEALRRRILHVVGAGACTTANRERLAA